MLPPFNVNLSDWINWIASYCWWPQREDEGVNGVFRVRHEKMKGRSSRVSYTVTELFNGEAAVPTETAWLWSMLSC